MIQADKTGQIKVRFLPHEQEIMVEKGATILAAGLEAGVHINASCGGEGVCGKCRVIIEQGKVEGGISEKLSAEDLQKNIRLACLAVLEEDVVVRVPPESLLDKAGLASLLKDEEQGQVQLKEPILVKHLVQVAPPTQTDNRSDLSRLISGLHQLGERNLQADFSILPGLPSAWRQGDWQLTASILRPLNRQKTPSRITRLEVGDKSQSSLAVAVDLGTTTVWAQLLDLADGRILGVEGDFNKQISYGEDVISRMIYAAKGEGAQALQAAAAESINSVLTVLAQNAGVDLQDIGLMTLAGNTTMTQLLLGVDTRYIRLDPYTPAANYYPPLKAKDFGLKLSSQAILMAFPAVASYVGGDVVSGVVGSGLHLDERLTLFIDMGTNGEVVVGNKDWLACAAASAGPAFEGGGIKFGMRAARGAIDNVLIDSATGEPTYTTVGRAKAKGICGSGLIALVAALLQSGLIDYAGRFNLHWGNPRLRQGEDGPEYVLAWSEETQIGRDLALTETDLDNLIRAKGAMYAAYITLLEGVGLTIHDLQRVIIAGGFGRSLNLEKAITIGLLPELELDKFTFVGNGSLMGARMLAFNNELRRQVRDVTDMMTNFELSAAPRYMDNYTGSLFLPHTEAQTLFPALWQKLQASRSR